MTIPDKWWREAAESIHHPLACVGLDNTFVWVNTAFEKMVGYSRAELQKKTWIELTVDADVGGDLASVQSVISGNSEQYTLFKRYWHKNGHEIPFQLTVWRHPKNVKEPLACFIVQAIRKTPAADDELKNRLRDLEKRLNLMAEKTGVNVTVGSNTGKGDMVGRDKTINSERTIYWLIAGVVALAIAVVWLAYYGSDANPKEKPDLSIPTAID